MSCPLFTNAAAARMGLAASVRVMAAMQAHSTRLNDCNDRIARVSTAAACPGPRNTALA